MPVGAGPLDRGTALRAVRRRAEAEFSGCWAPGGSRPTQGSLAQVGLCGFFGAVLAGLPVARAAARVLLWDVRLASALISKQKLRGGIGFIARVPSFS